MGHPDSLLFLLQRQTAKPRERPNPLRSPTCPYWLFDPKSTLGWNKGWLWNISTSFVEPILALRLRYYSALESPELQSLRLWCKSLWGSDIERIICAAWVSTPRDPCAASVSTSRKARPSVGIVSARRLRGSRGRAPRRPEPRTRASGKPTHRHGYPAWHQATGTSMQKSFKRWLKQNCTWFHTSF